MNGNAGTWWRPSRRGNNYYEQLLLIVGSNGTLRTRDQRLRPKECDLSLEIACQYFLEVFPMIFVTLPNTREAFALILIFLVYDSHD